MSIALSTVRAMSTKVPRPKNWQTSPFDAPQPLMAPLSPPFLPSTSSARRPPPRDPTPREYVRHRLAIQKAFPQGWSPPRKLSRDAMDSLRMLHNHSPDTFTTPVLAERFKISPEAVRRILRSRWVPDKERKDELRTRNEARKMEKKRNRVHKEWAEGVDKGMLRYRDSTNDPESELELT